MKRIFLFSIAALLLLSSVSAAGLAPVAEHITCETYRNVPVTGTLTAHDPEGDAVSFRITAQPEKGTVTLIEDGTFVYTPFANKKGRDVFSYTAVDGEGNRSEQAEVTVNIRRQKLSLTYSDMADSSAQAEAVRLAEAGIFLGERIGETAFFRPEETVTRGEFLAMCMTLCGETGTGSVSSSGFADESEMAAWVKPFVSAAAMAGLVEGYEQENGAVVFSSDNPITAAEAAVMMDRILEVSTVFLTQEEETQPAWAVQAMADLSCCGITVNKTGTELLTREEAAKLLCGAMELLSNRDGQKVSWLA